MDSVTEEWRSIPEFEGKYEASNHGNIRSLDRIVSHVNASGDMCDYRWKGRVLKPVLSKGYYVTKLGSCKTQFGYHQLIARTFIGPQSNGIVVNHINGIKTDNRPENLEYVTNSENVSHAYRTGLLVNRGRKHVNRKRPAARQKTV